MLWLARTALTSRLHAISLAVGFTLLPFFSWLGAAIVALVTLAKGPKESIMPLLCVVAACTLMMGDGQKLLLVPIVLTWCAAIVLWWSKSWIYVLITVMLLGAGQFTLLPVLSQAEIGQLTDLFNQMVEQAIVQAPEAPVYERITEQAVAERIQSSVLVFSVISLLFARSMQAKIYGSEGFRKEFHSIRLPYGLMAACLGTAFLASVAGGVFVSYIPILLLPLVFAGISLVHGSIAIKKLGGNWLLLFYVSMILVSSLTLLLLVIVSALDSVFDIRSRMLNARQVDQ